MGRLELAGPPPSAAERRRHLQRVAAQHVDGVRSAVRDEHEPLGGVAREREVPGRPADGAVPPGGGDQRLCHERPVRLEHLQALVAAVADVDAAVRRPSHAMRRVELLRQGSVPRERRLGGVVGRIAVGAPVTPVLAGVRVEDDHPPVGVAVADVDLVGRGVDEDAGRLAEEAGAAAARGAAAELADLQQEVAFRGELEHVGVVGGGPAGQVVGEPAAEADPDVVPVVDVNAVRLGAPRVPVARPAPAVDDVAGRIEGDDRRGALRSPLAVRPVDDPHVVLRIGRHPDDVAEQPVVGERLRPEGVDLERRRDGLGAHHRGAGDRRVADPLAEDEQQGRYHECRKPSSWHHVPQCMALRSK